MDHIKITLQESYKNYRTIVNRDFNMYYKEEKTKAVSAALRNKRKNLRVQDNLMIE